jgi:hypothetical protein
MRTSIKIINSIIFIIAIFGMLVAVMTLFPVGNIRFIESGKVVNETDISRLEVLFSDFWAEKDKLVVTIDNRLFLGEVVSVTGEEASNVVSIEGQEVTVPKTAVLGKVLVSLPFVGFAVIFFKSLYGWLLVLSFPVISFLYYFLKRKMSSLSVKNAEISEGFEPMDENPKTLWGKFLSKEEAFINHFEPKINNTVESAENKVGEIKKKFDR